MPDASQARRPSLMSVVSTAPPIVMAHVATGLPFVMLDLSTPHRSLCLMSAPLPDLYVVSFFTASRLWCLMSLQPSSHYACYLCSPPIIMPHVTKTKRSLCLMSPHPADHDAWCLHAPLVTICLMSPQPADQYVLCLCCLPIIMSWIQEQREVCLTCGQRSLSIHRQRSSRLSGYQQGELNLSVSQLKMRGHG